jgi:hypothetical protein
MATGSVQQAVIVGGDTRFGAVTAAGWDIHAFASSRYGGNGSIHRAETTITGGTVDLVLVLVRWLGHSDSERVTRSCAAAGVPFLLVRGGFSAVRRELQAFARGV